MAMRQFEELQKGILHTIKAADVYAIHLISKLRNEKPDESLIQRATDINVVSGFVMSSGVYRELEKKTFIEGSLVYAEIFTVIATFLVGMSLIGGDIKSNSISLYLVKPITRMQYLLGKYLGGVMLSASIFLFYLIFITVVLYIDGSSVQIPFFKIISLTLFKIALLYSLIIFFVQKMPGFVAALIGSAIYIGGYFAGDFYLMSLSTEGLIKYSSSLIYYLLPHLVEVSPGSVMSSSAGIMLFYSSCILL